MPFESIENVFSRKAVRRYAELAEAGIQNRDIQQALKDRVIMRAVILNREGPIPGLYITPEFNFDPDKALMLAMVVTGGQAVVARHTAVVRHDLAHTLGKVVQAYVPNGFRKAPSAANLELYRTRNKQAFSVGIDTIENEYGIPVAITSPARTIVDLLHGGRRLDDDYRTGLAALGTFISRGGEPGEVRGIAQSMGLDRDDYISRMVDATYEGTISGAPARC